MKSNLNRGILWSLLAAVSFGVSDTVQQFIAQDSHVSAYWFLSVRTFFTGTILLLIGVRIYGIRIFQLFRNLHATIRLIAYSILGLSFNLFAFYLCVQEGNSSIATILQYLSPLFILLTALIFHRSSPSVGDIIIFVISMLGVILVLTGGNLHQLSFSKTALLWGIGAGLSQALYLCLPKSLISQHYSPVLILGWGTLISSVFFNLKQPVWSHVPDLNLKLILSLSCVVLIGTVLSFTSFLRATKFISSEVISLTDAVEPLTTFGLSIIFFNLSTNLFKIIGIGIIIFAIMTLQISHHRFRQSIGTTTSHY